MSLPIPEEVVEVVKEAVGEEKKKVVVMCMNMMDFLLHFQHSPRTQAVMCLPWKSWRRDVDVLLAAEELRSAARCLSKLKVTGRERQVRMWRGHRGWYLGRFVSGSRGY